MTHAKTCACPPCFAQHVERWKGDQLMDEPTPTIQAIADVLGERARQVELGYDAQHDTGHTRSEWAGLAERYLREAVDAETWVQYRHALRKAAATMLAALEDSHRRGTRIPQR